MEYTEEQLHRAYALMDDDKMSAAEAFEQVVGEAPPASEPQTTETEDDPEAQIEAEAKAARQNETDQAERNENYKALLRSRNVHFEEGDSPANLRKLLGLDQEPSDDDDLAANVARANAPNPESGFLKEVERNRKIAEASKPIRSGRPEPSLAQKNAAAAERNE